MCTNKGSDLAESRKQKGNIFKMLRSTRQAALYVSVDCKARDILMSVDHHQAHNSSNIEER